MHDERKSWLAFGVHPLCTQLTSFNFFAKYSAVIVRHNSSRGVTSPAVKRAVATLHSGPVMPCAPCCSPPRLLSPTCSSGKQSLREAKSQGSNGLLYSGHNMSIASQRSTHSRSDPDQLLLLLFALMGLLNECVHRQPPHRPFLTNVLRLLQLVAASMFSHLRYHAHHLLG